MARSTSLPLPFALVGLAGGWLTADLFRIGDGDEWVRAVLAVVTAVNAGLLGRILERVSRSWPAWQASLIWPAAILLAGVVNGAMIGGPAAGLRHVGDGLAIGAVVGGFCALPFVPALGLVEIAARRVGRAREGSIVDAMDRRRVWLATLAPIGVGTLAALPRWHHPHASPLPTAPVTFALGIAVAAAIAALLLRDARDLIGVRAAQRQLAEMRPRDPRAPDAYVRGMRLIDFGLGEESAEQVKQAGVVYREVDRVLAVFRGSPREARRALGRSIALGAVALALTVGAVTALRLDPSPVAGSPAPAQRAERATIRS